MSPLPVFGLQQEAERVQIALYVRLARRPDLVEKSLFFGTIQKLRELRVQLRDRRRVRGPLGQEYLDVFGSSRRKISIVIWLFRVE
jgi:hypothetical protein